MYEVKLPEDFLQSREYFHGVWELKQEDRTMLLLKIITSRNPPGTLYKLCRVDKDRCLDIVHTTFFPKPEGLLPRVFGNYVAFLGMGDDGHFRLSFFNGLDFAPMPELDRQLADMDIYTTKIDEEGKGAVLYASDGAERVFTTRYFAPPHGVVHNAILEHVGKIKTGEQGPLAPSPDGREMYGFRKVADAPDVTRAQFFYVKADGEVGVFSEDLDRTRMLEPSFRRAFVAGVLVVEIKDLGTRRFRVWVASRFGTLEDDNEESFKWARGLERGRVCLAFEEGFVILDSRTKERQEVRFGPGFLCQQMHCIRKKLLVFLCAKSKCLRIYDATKERVPEVRRIDLDQVTLAGYKVEFRGLEEHILLRGYSCNWKKVKLLAFGKPVG